MADSKNRLKTKDWSASKASVIRLNSLNNLNKAAASGTIIEKTVERRMLMSELSGSEPIYILCAEEAYRQARLTGTLTSDSLATEGFIHASPRHQLNRVANLYYAQLPSLILLTVDPARSQSEVRWEKASSGDLYPHIYGPLNLDAITQVAPVQRGTDGQYRF